MEKMNKKDKTILLVVGIIVVAILVAIICALCFKKKNYINASRVKELISSDNTSVILFTSDDCKFCKTAIKDLDSKKISYYVYDTSKNSSGDLNKALNYLSVDKKLFKTPSIIYIKDNIMYANMINLNSTSDLDSFIKQYKLTSVKFEK